MQRFFLCLGALCLAACSSGGLLAAGAHCSTSEECANGLLCDTSSKPAVCSTMVAHRNDLASPDDLRGVVQDLTGVVQDMSATADDLAPPQDLAKHD
jgi:hypothetical protein